MILSAMTSTLAGPLASFYNFLNMVALPNCVAYFEEKDDADRPDTTKRELTRLLFNAVVSLDSAFDYRYHQVGSDGKVTEHLKAYSIEHGCPALVELRDISNALKHCIRGYGTKPNPDKVHAPQILPVQMQGSVSVSDGIPTVTATLSAEILAQADEALTKAFHYWYDWSQTATSDDVDSAHAEATTVSVKPEDASVSLRPALAQGDLVKPNFSRVRGLANRDDTGTGTFTLTDSMQGFVAEGPKNEHWRILFPVCLCWVHHSVLEIVQSGAKTEREVSALVACAGVTNS